jgi:hypothetical protein
LLSSELDNLIRRGQLFGQPRAGRRRQHVSNEEPERWLDTSSPQELPGGRRSSRARGVGAGVRLPSTSLGSTTGPFRIPFLCARGHDRSELKD